MQFSELNDEAKARARGWWLKSYEFDDEFVIDDAANIAELFGLDIRVKVVKTQVGVRYEPAVYWSGFWSQGDGASFSGRYAYCKGALAAVKAYAPQDERLHSIVQRLQEVQRRNFYGLHVTVSQEGRYCHEGTMRFDVFHRDAREVPESDEEELADCLRDFAGWIYRQLEAEYEYQTSDEAVDEMINEYEFDEEGRVV
jgi:hypothetical protein